MQLSGDLDISPLLSKLKQVSALTMKEMKPLIRQQGAIFLTDRKTGMMGVTPPMNDSLKGNAAKQAGERSVEMGVRKVYGTPGDLWVIIRNKAGKGVADNFWAYVKLKRWTQANDIAERITGFRLREFDDGAEHAARRNKRTGRVVGRVKSRFVNEPGHINRYIKAKQRNVGLLASGWYEAGNRARLSLRGVPAWVKRHASRGSGIGYERDGGEAFTLTLGNTTRYGINADTRRRARAGLMYRVNAIKRKLPYIARAAARAAKLNA